MLDAVLRRVSDAGRRCGGCASTIRWRRSSGSSTSTSTIARDRPRASSTRMNWFEMLLFLEALTGIEGLIPDPYFGGGGLHQIEPGGFLKIHADFNVHPKLKLDRRLNMLIYLNRDWREEYGGHLELWDADDARVPQARSCRCSTARSSSRRPIRSYHGHPHPLTSPPGRDAQVGVALLLHGGAAGGGALRAARHDLRIGLTGTAGSDRIDAWSRQGSGSADSADAPEDASLEDIEYHIYVRQKIQQGLDDVDAGRVVSHSEVQRRLAKWLTK